MANNLETNPIGKNTLVYQIQKKLYDKLQPLWNTELDGYPICYSIKRDGEKTKSIEYYKGLKEYSKNLIVREVNKFFFVSDYDIRQETIESYSSQIDLYFILNLKECKPNIDSRSNAIAEILNDISNVLLTFSQIGLNTNIITDLDRVFQGYTYDFKLNLHPYFCCKLTLNITDFNLNDKLC